MMNPLLDEAEEKKFDAMIDELDKVGFKWDGALVTAPDGYKFYGILNAPFYRQVYVVWNYYQCRKDIINKGA